MRKKFSNKFIGCGLEKVHRKIMTGVSLLFSGLFVISSCTDDIEDSQTTKSLEKSVDGLNLRALYSENHVIPVNEAREIALKAVDMFSDGSTRSYNKVIESLGVYSRPSCSPTTRSMSEDTMLYVFNFENNGGFAIVSADDRIPTQILAYVEEGSLENEVENPGLFYALEQLQDYAEYSIEEFEKSKDSLLKVAEDNSFVVDVNKLQTRTVYTGTSYEYLSESTVGPLISVTWGQGSPYNMYVETVCPNNSGGKAPVGCVATATAQIMSYWKYPSTLNQYSMNWTSMCSTMIPTESNKSNIARLMREIGREVNMSYGCNGSGAQTSDAYEFLSRIGYHKYFSGDFNVTSAKSAIDLSRPLLVKGCGTKTTSGRLWNKKTTYSDCHAWVIDGYKTVHYKQDNYRIDTNTGSYTSNISYVDEYYFHNNWGWEGNGNGYFAAGCFDLRNAYEYDQTTSSSYNFQYKNQMFCVYR